MLQHLNNEPRAPERVVVVGARGFVGAAIVRNLRGRGVPVLPLGRGDVDLAHPGAGRKLAENLRSTDAVVTVSAIAPVKNPAMLKENITIIEAFAEALRTKPVAHVLNIGSDAIYSDSAKPLSESSCRSPESLHGLMHLTREVMLADAAGNTPFATLRPTLIYGIDDPHNGYGPNRFRRLAAEGKTITLFGNGEERRDHVWVADVADLAARILLNRSRGSLNAATGEVISFRDAAELIANQYAKPVRIEATPRQGPMPHNGYRPFDPSGTVLAFPDFLYTRPREGFKKVCAQAIEAA